MHNNAVLGGGGVHKQGWRSPDPLFRGIVRSGFWFSRDRSVRWLCLAEPRAGLVDF